MGHADKERELSGSGAGGGCLNVMQLATGRRGGV